MKLNKKALAILLALAMTVGLMIPAMAANGDTVKVDNPKEYTYVGTGQPMYVIFKQSNNYIAIWTPTSAHESQDYYYNLALKVTGSGSLDAFNNGTVEFFYGENATVGNNGSNIGTYMVVQSDGKWYAYSSGGKISIVIYGEGESEPDPGRLEITKAFSINGSPAGAPEGFSAAFAVTGPDSYSETFAYPGDFTDGVLAIGNLAPGKYTVTEDTSGDGSGYAWSVSGTGDVDVSAGQTATVNVTNSHYDEQLPATLRINKTFSGSFSEGTIPANWTAHFIVYRILEDEAGIYEEIFAEFDLAAGGPMTRAFPDEEYPELPFGSYRVEETTGSIGGYNWSHTYSRENGVVDVVEAGEANLTVNNNYWTTTRGPDPGSIVVTKAFNISDIPGNWSATISVTGPNGYNQSRTITSANLRATFDNLAAGDYMVVETDPSGIPNYTLVSVAGEGSYSVADGRTTSVTITNNYDSDEPPVFNEEVLGDEDTPLSFFESEDEEVVFDEEVPLGDMPQTGVQDTMWLWVIVLCAGLLATGTLGATVVMANRKKD